MRLNLGYDLQLLGFVKNPFLFKTCGCPYSPLPPPPPSFQVFVDLCATYTSNLMLIVDGYYGNNGVYSV